MLVSEGHDLGEQKRLLGPASAQKPVALADGVVVAVAALGIDEPDFRCQTQLVRFRDDGIVHGLIDLIQFFPSCLGQVNRAATKQLAGVAFVRVLQTEHRMRHRRKRRIAKPEVQSRRRRTDRQVRQPFVCRLSVRHLADRRDHAGRNRSQDRGRAHALSPTRHVVERARDSIESTLGFDQAGRILRHGDCGMFTGRDGVIRSG